VVLVRITQEVAITSLKTLATTRAPIPAKVHQAVLQETTKKHQSLKPQLIQRKVHKKRWKGGQALHVRQPATRSEKSFSTFWT
jgi:hypothetical protein